MRSSYFVQCLDHDSGGWWSCGSGGWDGWEGAWGREEKRTVAGVWKTEGEEGGESERFEGERDD